MYGGLFAACCGISAVCEPPAVKYPDMPQGSSALAPHTQNKKAPEYSGALEVRHGIRKTAPT